METSSGIVLTPAPRVTFSNGVCAANYSSPHPFNFTDGSVLLACSEERSRMLSMIADEHELPNPFFPGVIDIHLSFTLTDICKEALTELQSDRGIDVIIVPLPVLEALKREDRPIGKARTIRMADRISKKSHTDRFCL